MKNQIIDLALKQGADEAELFYNKDITNSVAYAAGKFQSVNSNSQSGVSLRIIQDGKLGFSYSTNLNDIQTLVENAQKSLKGNVKVDYSFNRSVHNLEEKFMHGSFKEMGNTDLVKELKRVREYIAKKSKQESELSLYGGMREETYHVLNSHGVDLKQSSNYEFFQTAMAHPGSSSQYRMFLSEKFDQFPQETLDTLIDLFDSSKEVVTPKGGKMKVLFTPPCQYLFNMRFQSVFNGKSLCEETTPLMDKLGQQIMSEKITIIDNPEVGESYYPMLFDHEGVLKKPLTIVENGVLKNFFYDLNTAHKMGTSSTGHGMRTSMWNSYSISLKPNPRLMHVQVAPGDKSFKQLVESIDRGVVLEVPVGAHSGNIPNGDFSVGMAPGFYVEDGKVVGRIKNGMVAGNIFEVLSNVIDIEDKGHLQGVFKMPSILCDNVSVST